MKRFNYYIACPPTCPPKLQRQWKPLLRWVTFLPSLLIIVFVSFLAFRFPLPVQAGLLDPCTSSPECGADWLYCNDKGRCAPLNPVVYNSSLEKFQTIVKKAEEKGETNLQWYLGSSNGTIEATTNALTGLIVGNDINWEELHAGNFQNANIAGAYGFTSNLVAQVLTQPPVSSREYFADLGRNFGLAKPAYAQGIGFKGLSNLLPLWKATRNLAYILFVIIFLATGLAIMFRVKLDPKTVVTIQNAIPKLIIALILVTFSYAIVGLLIDLIYLIIYLGVLALEGPIKIADPSITIAAEQAKYTSLSFLDGVGLILGGGIGSLGNLLTRSTGTGAISILVHSLLGVLGFLTIGSAGGILAALPILILAVIALFLILKLFFSLIMCYISIIISVIVAPLQIMLGALPGSTMGFSSWFKNLLANILVFPAVALFLLIGWLLISINNINPGSSWTPPVMGVGGDLLPTVIGFGMLLLVNKVPDMVKIAFKIKPTELGGPIAWITKGVETEAQKRVGGYVVGGGLKGTATSTATTIGDRIKALSGSRYSGSERV